MPAAKMRSQVRIAGSGCVQHMLAFARTRNAPKLVDLKSIQYMGQLLRSSVGPGIGEYRNNFAPDLPGLCPNGSALEMADTETAVNAEMQT